MIFYTYILYRTIQYIPRGKQLMEPTQETYSQLHKAYGFFKQVLFGNRLTPCIITLQRQREAYGYFWGNTWRARREGSVTDEIALNPDSFQDRSDMGLYAQTPEISEA